MASGTAIYHPDEVEVREYPGTTDSPEFLAGIVQSSVSASLHEFLAVQRWVAVANRSSDRRVWCSLLTGTRGFLSTPNEHTVRIDVLPVTEDPLRSGNPSRASNIELLAADCFEKGRVKVKGQMEKSCDGITVHVREVTSLCRKHIQIHDDKRSKARRLAPDAPPAMPTCRRDIILNAKQQEWLRSVDGLFMATYNRLRGPECWAPWWPSMSCQVIDNRTLLFPYFSDNGMYNTIANLTHDSHAGLLLLDYEHGGTLQVTGHAQAIVDNRWTDRLGQASAVVEFTVEETLVSCF
jgi:hypothetical protein